MNRTRVVRAAIGAVSKAVEPLAMALQRRRDAGAVLLYHRVSPHDDATYPPLAPTDFERHCEFVSKHLTVLSVEELVERHERGASLRGCCAITFDDGYRDFLEFAYPILREFGYPATHFLVASSIERGAPPWTYREKRLGARLGAGAAELGARTMADRESWLGERETEREGDGGGRAARAALPAMLNAEDLRAVDAGLIEWGSHSRSHAFLDRVDAAELRAEIVDSKAQLEGVIGRPVRFFAYPNGYFNDDAMRAVRDAGFEAAFAVGHALVRAGSPRFALPRIDMGTYPPSMLALEVTGAVQVLRNLRPARPA